MKKVLLTVCLFVMATVASAQLADKVAGTYTGDLDVFFQAQFPTANNVSVEIEKSDDLHINFYLNNFVLSAGGDVIPVGNVTLTNIELTQDVDSVKFTATQTITIAAGNLEEYGQDDWMGPILGPLSVSISGKVVGDSVIIEPITIPLGELVGTVSVTFKGKNPSYVAIKDVKMSKVVLTASAVQNELSFAGIEGAANYAIYNIAGNMVKQGYTAGRVDVSAFSNGIYLVKIGDATMKFVKR